MKHPLLTIVPNVFESVAFWDLDCSEESTYKLPETPKICQVICSHPSHFKLTFVSEYSVAQCLSDDINQNLFGGGEESVNDCLKEMMNIIGGDYCIQRFPQEDFTLSLPEIVQEFSTENSTYYTFTSDEGSFYFFIHE